jgi:hypothetical protein
MTLHRAHRHVIASTHLVGSTRRTLTVRLTLRLHHHAFGHARCNPPKPMLTACTPQPYSVALPNHGDNIPHNNPGHNRSTRVSTPKHQNKSAPSATSTIEHSQTLASPQRPPAALAALHATNLTRLARSSGRTLADLRSPPLHRGLKRHHISQLQLLSPLHWGLHRASV